MSNGNCNEVFVLMLIENTNVTLLVNLRNKM